MNIGGQVIRLIERADPHEAEQGTAAKIIAPQGYTTLRTAGDVLTLTAVRGRINDLRLRIQVHHAIGLDQRIQGERGTGLALTPPAMTAMHEERDRLHAVANQTAVAASVQRKHLTTRGHEDAPGNRFQREFGRRSSEVSPIWQTNAIA